VRLATVHCRTVTACCQTVPTSIYFFCDWFSDSTGTQLTVSLEADRRSTICV
jgi:hypothetical protein